MGLLAAIVFLAATGDASLAAGRASGTVSVNGQEFGLAWAYARPDGYRVEVIVTDRPLAEERLDGEVPLERAAVIAHANYVRFDLVAGQATHWGVASPAGGGGGGDGWDTAFQFAPDAGAEVAGRLSSRGPVDVMGRSVTLSGRLRARGLTVVETPPRTPAEGEARARLKSRGYAPRPADLFQASFDRPDLLPTFLAAGLSADTRFPHTDETLLMSILARDGDCDGEAELGMVRDLLAGGANANQRDEQWQRHSGTPLERAYPCAGTMGLLLDAGARLSDLVGAPQAKETIGASLMKQAIEDDDAEVVGLLLTRGLDARANGSAWLKAAAGKAEIVSLLRRAGARPAAARPTRAR